MKKRFLSLFVAIVMVVTMVPAISVTGVIARSWTITVVGDEYSFVQVPDCSFEDEPIDVVITPEEPYELESLIVDGEDVTSDVVDGVYTFTMPMKDVTISVSFKSKPSEGSVVFASRSDTKSYVPIYTYYKYSVSQYVIPAEQLSAFEGQFITSLKYFYKNTLGEDVNRNLEIRLMEVENTTLDGFVNVSDATVVFDGFVSIPMDEEQLHFTMLKDFYLYEGGNLLVTVNDKSGFWCSQDGLNFYGIEDVEDTYYNYRDDEEFSLDNLDSIYYSCASFVPMTEIYFGDVNSFFDITVQDSENGAVITSSKAQAGKTSTLVIKADFLYELEKLTVNGEDVTSSVVNDVYMFTMPEEDVTVGATFKSVFDDSAFVFADGTDTYYVPFLTDSDYSMSQYVIPAEQLSEFEDQFIASLRYFYYSGYAYDISRELEIRLMEVEDTAFDDFVDLAYATVVFDGEVMLSPGDGSIKMNFTHPYGYDGGNLLVTVYDKSGYRDYHSRVTFYGVEGDEKTKYYYRDDVAFDLDNLYTVENVYEGRFVPMTLLSFVELDNVYNISIQDSENGTVKAPSKVQAGKNVTLAIKADFLYELEKLIVNDVDVTSSVLDGEYTFTMPEADVTVAATFKKMENMDAIRITMYDEGSDTWNYAKILVDVNGETQEVTHPAYTDEAYSVYLAVPKDAVVTFTWISGNYDMECRFAIYRNDIRLYVNDDCSNLENEEIFFTSTPDGEAYPTPEAPTDLKATINADSTVTLTWSDVAVNESGYRIYEIVAGELSGRLVATLEADVTSWTSGVIDAMKPHVYWLEVYNATGSERSENVIVGYGAALSDASISLDESLTMNYWVVVYDENLLGDAELSMRFTMNGKIVTVTDYEEGDGECMFAFEGISPERMGDNIKAELLADGRVISVVEEYSVRENAEMLLEEYPDDEILVQLVTDLLNYGAAAQIYKGYKTDALVNAGIAGTPSTALPGESENVKELVTEEGVVIEDVYFTGVTVWFDNINKIGVKLNSYTENTVVVVKCINLSMPATVVEPESLTYSNLTSNTVYTEGIYAIDMGVVYAFELYEDGELIQTLTYSMASYVYSMMNKVDEEGNPTAMAELAKAFYRYCISAGKYKINSGK